MAAVSHLPHVLANVLVAQAARRARGARAAARRPARASATRPASPAPTAIWADIYLANADALVAAIDDTVRAARGGARGAAPARDGARSTRWNDAAREDRRRLLEAELAGGEVRELRVSVPNRPGVVAEVALALGRAGVNIVDMALYPAADNAPARSRCGSPATTTPRAAEALIGELGLPVARP